MRGPKHKNNKTVARGTADIESRLARVSNLAVLAVFSVLFSAQVISSAIQKSATFDEPVNLTAGYVELTLGDYRVMPQNLPFVKMLAALPLAFMDVRLPPEPRPWTGASRWAFAHRFLYKANDGDRLLFFGRLAVLPISLLLGWLVFWWTNELYGKIAALFALLLYGFEPNILGHSGLVTTDLAVSCLMFLAVYGFYRLQEQVSVTRVFVLSLAVGLSLLTKYSVLPLVLILLLLSLRTGFTARPLDVRIKEIYSASLKSPGAKLLSVGLVFFSVALASYVIVWAGYRFSYESASALDISYSRLYGNSGLRDLVARAQELRLLPEPYLAGVDYLLGKTGTFVSYLFGETEPGGWWYYFFATFALKTPLSLILLVALGLVFFAKWREKRAVAAAFLLMPAAVYFALISASGWNIGHRHLLPIYPFFFVFAGGWMAWAMRQGRWARGGVAAMLLWYLFSSVSIHPHYLAYFNELAGGPDGGHKYLVDSNLDWGQDLKGLKRYMDKEGIERVWLSYFGTASPDYYGIDYDYLPSYVIFEPKNVNLSIFELETLIPLPGTVAISATNLQGPYLPHVPGPVPLSRDYFARYRDLEPAAKIGYSIFVYRFK